jgi:copper homeostasis protein
MMQPGVKRVVLEVCVDSAAGIEAAVAGGADRIELCSSLELGGLTPSPGVMRRAARAPCPVYAMIRPRPGDFVYGRADLAAMLADIDATRQAGLAGVVLGASRPDGTLDAAMLEILLEHASGLGTTLHRAFDVVPDQDAALETAVALGFERILSSGAAGSALAGARVLGKLVIRAGERIVIMAGGGITADTLPVTLAASGVREVHASCRGKAVRHAGADRIEMALGARQETRADAVARLAARCRRGEA